VKNTAISNMKRSVYIHQTNEYFTTYEDAAEALGLTYGSFRCYLKPSTPNIPQWFIELQICTFLPSPKCPMCGKEVSDKDLYKNQKGFLCIKCNRKRAKTHKVTNPEKAKDWNLKNNYKLSLKEFNQKLEEQNNCCAICGRNFSEFKKGAQVDHNHQTGKVRGLLCSPCNTAIGSLKADKGIDVLCSAISYLRNTDGR